jgi:hypothetical protein
VTFPPRSCPLTTLPPDRWRFGPRPSFHSPCSQVREQSSSKHYRSMLNTFVALSGRGAGGGLRQPCCRPFALCEIGVGEVLVMAPPHLFRADAPEPMREACENQRGFDFTGSALSEFLTDRLCRTRAISHCRDQRRLAARTPSRSSPGTRLPRPSSCIPKPREG